jgi:hypothetical protein
VVQAAGGESPSLGGEADEPRPAVAGVRPALDPAAARERHDELAHRLVGHLGPRRELGEPGAAGIDVLEQRVVGGVDGAEAVGLQPACELLDHEPGGAAEADQDGEDAVVVGRHA